MPIVCPHKLCKINLPTKKDTVPTVSFFALKDKVTEDKMTK